MMTIKDAKALWMNATLYGTLISDGYYDYDNHFIRETPRGTVEFLWTEGVCKDYKAILFRKSDDEYTLVVYQIYGYCTGKVEIYREES